MRLPVRNDVANIPRRPLGKDSADGIAPPPGCDADAGPPASVDARLFATVLDSMGQGISVFGADLRLLVFNSSYAELFEYPPDFLRPGLTYEQILRFNVARGEYGGDDPEGHIRGRLERVRSPEHAISRHEHVRPNGAVIALRRTPLPGGGFINTYTNITARKRAEREAERNAAILQATIDNMADGVRVFDKDLRLLMWNRQVFDLFGFPEDMAHIGTPYKDFLEYTIQRGDYSSDPRQESLGEKLGRANDPTVRDVEQELPNGRIVEKRRNPMPGGGFVSTYLDVTERRHSEQALARQARELALATEELKRSNDELQQFAYVASHDLQEPLRMVGSYCQLLQRRYRGKLGPDADEFIGFAVEGAKRMQNLINDLLLYSRVGTKGKQLAATPMEQVLDSALANLTVAIGEAEAEITRDPLPTVMGDTVQLTQLLQNLVGNALKFRDGVPVRIHVGAERDGAMWRIRVQDNGIGIQPQYAERIFMIFQRLHTRQEYPGTGIGLSICKKIVERHGGRIWFESAPAKGSIFNFTLPDSGETPCSEQA
jgi:signal transduction histidine kinase